MGRSILQARIYASAPAGEYPLAVFTVGLTDHRQWAIRPGGFSALQLFLCSSGSGVFRFFDVGECTLGSNQLLIVPQGVAHEYYPDTEHGAPWLLGYFSLTGRHLDELFRYLELPYLQVIHFSDNEEIWSLLRRIWELSEHESPDVQWEAGREVYALLAELRRQSRPGSELAILKKAVRGEVAVEQAMKIINEHFAEPLLMSLLCKTLGFTHQHLNRLFKKKLDITLYQYLQRVRMEKSVHYLQKTTLTVQEIAKQIGMNTGNYIRLFARRYGSPPAQWRERHWAPTDNKPKDTYKP